MNSSPEFDELFTKAEHIEMNTRHNQYLFKQLFPAPFKLSKVAMAAHYACLSYGRSIKS